MPTGVTVTLPSLTPNRVVSDCCGKVDVLTIVDGGVVLPVVGVVVFCTTVETLTIGLFDNLEAGGGARGLSGVLFGARDLLLVVVGVVKTSSVVSEVFSGATVSFFGVVTTSAKLLG